MSTAYFDDTGIDACFIHAIASHVPNTWNDQSTATVGDEISFTRFFYAPQPLRTLAEIRADIESLERETDGLLGEIVGAARQ